MATVPGSASTSLRGGTALALGCMISTICACDSATAAAVPVGGALLPRWTLSIRCSPR